MNFRLVFVFPLLLFLYIFGFAQNDNLEFERKVKHTRWQALRTAKTKPDSAISLYLQCINDYQQLGDSAQTITLLNELGDLYATMTKYDAAYDSYWGALLLAEAGNDSILIPTIYNGLASLYWLYGRVEKAKQFYHASIALKKRLIEKEKIAPSSLIKTYYGLVIFHREMGNIKLASMYLDSCRYYSDSRTLNNQHYLLAEEAFLLCDRGKLKQAEQLMFDIEPRFLEKAPQYLVILYFELGELYAKNKQLGQAKSYYNKSLELAIRYSAHKNYIPMVHNKLSLIYRNENKYKLAYTHLLQAKKSNDSIFGAKSLTNSKLLEIKDQYRTEKETRKKVIAQARLTELEQEKKIWRLNNLVLLGSFITLLVVMMAVFWLLRTKHKNELDGLVEKQRLDEQRNHQILEIKNKELTSSALQLIQKDELLIDIREKLLGYRNSEKKFDPEPILSQIKSNSKQDWAEFDARFTAVNESFYKSLQGRFPSLTQSELKLCALIRLNFSSKEMVSLLGISIESVHTARYRLRKKLGLARSDNLVEFMSKV